MEPVTACETCFKINLPSCIERIYIEAGLDDTTDYTFTITDKFGAKYKGDVEVAYGGNFFIDLTDEDIFPAGLFTQHSGTFLLQISEPGPYCDVITTLSFCDSDYDCVEFSFYELQPVTVTATIECCEEAPET